MCDNCELDLDSLPRAELGAMPYDVAKVLDVWLHEQHGVISSHHGVGAFLDALAAAGYRVTPIVVPPLEQLLPAATD